MKTYQSTSANNLRSIVMMVSLTVSGMLLSSCSKEESITPGSSNSAITSADGNESQRMAPENRFTIELPLIYVQHVGGFRGTPQFNFAVYANGKVVYTGIRNVGTIGKKQYDVNSEVVSELAKFMVEHGFLTFRDKYPFICDGSQHTTMLRGDVGRQSFNKTVIDYSVAVPAELLLIRETLEDKLGITSLVNAKTIQTTSIAQVSQ